MMGPGADSTTNTRRVFAFFVVVAVHVIMIWGINAGLKDMIMEKVIGNLQTVEIAAPKEEEERPPPPPPKMETPPPFVPPPEISIDTPPVETTAIQVVTQQRPTEAPPTTPVSAPSKSVETAPGFRRQPGTTDEFYPPASIRVGEEGSIVVAIRVSETGTIDNVEVAESSGYPRLDAGAIAYVKTWKLKPGTRDGKPVAMTWKIRVIFKLKK